MKKIIKTIILVGTLLPFGTSWAAEPVPAAPAAPRGDVFIVPNFHPASCGWLTNWSLERNYCANSYLAHLDRVGEDKNYHFVISECNNLIAILNFRPERFEELKQRIHQGRVEAVNAFFLEPTICLSGGEALVKMGVEGLRWQQAALGVRPRFCWMIDVCGTHAQMPQICKGLRLEALVMVRPFSLKQQAVFWYESTDGSKVLTLLPQSYADLPPIFSATKDLTGDELKAVEERINKHAAATPAGAPVLVLGGCGDYSLPPAVKESPTTFLKQFKSFRPDVAVRFATLAQYFDVLTPLIKAGKIELQTMRGESEYYFNSFWIQCPKVKRWYRRTEHGLQATEALATIASLQAGYAYPAQDLYHAWLLMCLNMDRNTLWGAAGGMVFEHPTSWDALDRFQWVDANNRKSLLAAGRKLLGEGAAIALFNPANWTRQDPQALALPAGKSLAGMACEQDGDGQVLCAPGLPSVGTVGLMLDDKPAETPKAIAPPKTVENAYYVATLDPALGTLVGLKVKPSLREVLGGPAGVVVAEQGVYDGEAGDLAKDRPHRPRIKATSDFHSTVTATEGPLTITVVATGDFPGGPCRRVTLFYKNSPRIDFQTELNDVPDKTIVVAEFPLAESPLEIRRGVPFGFSHGAWAKPNPALSGWNKGITPAVRWSDYTFADGAGLAILDRGLSGREIQDKTPIIHLFNATEKYYVYPCEWLSGKGKHRLEYAVVPHEGGWKSGRIPQMAWEYNCPPMLVDDVAEAKVRSFIRTSDNVVVEAVRREGGQIELRLVECFGEAGQAEVKVLLPHTGAALTDMLGGEARPLAGGPTYSFPVRPQQIVTMRLGTTTAVPAIKVLTRWDDLVPVLKREALNSYRPDLQGHPPRGK